MVPERGFSAEHIFVSSRGFHFKFATAEIARSFYRACLSANQNVVIEGMMVVDIGFGGRLKTRE